MQEKEEQLRRLNNGMFDLQEINHELTSYRDSVIKLELSASTWHESLTLKFFKNTLNAAILS
ncbi:hypothetical protein [Bacillus sp. B1-b2]|uniref:hypothetical protein n=1 Tax=Bacillus sp. B1-b2 TaxID=2653201 RepID=UPI001D0220BF|nr:hypothetical protein [Bacillus sp. B1-b2]